MKLASQKELNYVKQLLTDEEIDLAIKELRNLCKKYPGDTVVYQELGSVLLRQGINVSEALYILSLAINRYNKYSIAYEIGTYYLGQGNFTKAEEEYKKTLEGSPKDKCYGLLGLIRTNIHTEDYKKALEYFDELRMIRKTLDFEVSHYYNLKYYLLYKNGKQLKDVNADVYFIRQLLNYSKEEAIIHIKEHLKQADSEDLYTKRFHSVFEKETDIEALYDYCSDAIKDKKPSGYGLVDYYICELNENIGTSYSKKETTYVEIITMPNTKEILSIYPVYEKHLNKVSNQKTEERKCVIKQKQKQKHKSYKKNHE